MPAIKRFIDCYIPVTTCTLRCKYCYVTTHQLFGGKIPDFQYSLEYVRKALSKERLGGVCLFNMCANGETLLLKGLIDYVRALLEEGHYVMIVTNGTLTNRFDEYAALPKELLAHLFFKFSYHYMELKEKNLLDIFFGNIRKMRDAGASFTLEQTPSDDAIPYRDEIIERAVKELGAAPHITVARDQRIDGKLPILTELSREEYIKMWGDKYHSPLFDYKMEIFGVKRKEFCYAGDWTAYMNFITGDMRQCGRSYMNWNVYKDISKPIPFCAIGKHCQELHCYNGHVWISLGAIPELKAPTYAEMRNRVCMDGSEWLKPEMKAFMSTKLYNMNAEYTISEKIYADIENRLAEFNHFRERVVRKAKKMVLLKRNYCEDDKIKCTKTILPPPIHAKD